MKLQDLNHSTLTELVNYTIDGLENLKDSNVYGCDIHNEIFNTDYFIIGRYQAEQWLINNYGIFNAIEEIQQYEEDSFGEVNTKLFEAEHVCNMFVYIVGELILQESETLTGDCWNERTEPGQIEQIINELKELL